MAARSAKRRMSNREKSILGLTVVIGLGALLWIGYLEQFIADYQEVSRELRAKQKTYERQRKILAKGARVEEAYAQIEANLPPPIEDKRPEMQFAEEIAGLFAQLKLEAPSISPHREEEVPGAEDFVYIVLPITNIRADLEEMSRLLKGLYERNLLVQKLRLEASGGRKESPLRLTIEVARLVQTKDLAQPETEPVRRR